MFKSKHRQHLRTAGLFILLSIIGLWSWNTLSELFSLPHAQYKHALAVITLLLILRRSLIPSNIHWKKGNA